MSESKMTIGAYARVYGLYMGIFWAVKFVFFPLGFSYPVFSFIFLLLTIMVPFVGAWFVKKIRDGVLDGRLGFWQAFLLSTNIYMYASLIAAIVHFIYFRFIDNGFILNSYLESVNQMQELLGSGEAAANIEMLKANVELMGTLSPIQIVFSLLSNNVVFGLFISLLAAVFLKRR
ncbi:MAG TPA: DUF4199 domain-containing protein [Candidatus Avibacteroides excrementipullorum]|mgnify:CR=1 FL=1|jgi:hypothetical protein|nr:DUF4199 domain-containing protein [Candidatus Avibacteroides excrementipullorum]